MEGGCPALVVLLVDGDGGQAATHSPFLIDDNLHPGSKVLLKEMGHSRAPDPSSNNSCQQAQQTKQGRREGTMGERLVTHALPRAERGPLARARTYAAGLRNFKGGVHSPSFQML